MVAKKISPQKKKKQKKKSSVRKKKKKQFILPLWVHYFLFGILACVFFLAFYYFFISPYKYRWQKCMGIRAYGVCIPVGNYIYGIDVSRHQGAIEWDKVSETQSSEVPLDFVFKGSKVEIARQIGNAVPPKLAKAIGDSIITYYKGKR